MVETTLPDGGFGPPFATGGSAGATIPFWFGRLDRSVPFVTGQATPGTGIGSDNLSALSVTVLGRDVAGNVSSNSSPALIVEDRSGAGIVAVNPNVQTFGFRHADAVLDISDGDQAVLEASVTGTLAQATDPCTRGVDLYMHDTRSYAPNGVLRFQSAMTPLPVEEDAGERRWRYQFTYAPAEDAPANPVSRRSAPIRPATGWSPSMRASRSFPEGMDLHRSERSGRWSAQPAPSPRDG